MTYPEILIPFALPPAEHANDLVKMLASECGTDGLATLLSRNQSLVRTQFDDFSPELPHEVWLNARFKTKHYSLVQHYANSLKIDLNPGHWFLLNPVHLHVARNHLVLTDYRQLDLSEYDSHLLFEKAKSLCHEVGVELVFGSATTWFLRANDWADFATSSPDAACGHNIEIWSVKGTNELAWRKLQNEIQMEWFIHPIQHQREERGEKVVNGLWLWAGTALPTGFKAEIDFCRVGTFLGTPLLNQWGHRAKETSYAEEACVAREVHSAGKIRALENPSPALPTLRLSDQLSSAALSNDWGTWAELMIELERDCFKPLCAALKKREITQLQLHLSNSKTLLSLQTSSSALRKFWRNPTFKNLVP